MKVKSRDAQLIYASFLNKAKETMTDNAVSTFLEDVLYSPAHGDNQTVLVTLTFAQSLDAKIAGINGKQLILSCKESMFMTHMYAILILYMHNCRGWPS